MKLTKLFLISSFLLINMMLYSNSVNIKDFTLSSYGLKSYNKAGDIKSEVNFTAKHKVTKITRYYYNEDNNLDKIEYYAGQAEYPEYITYTYKKNVLIMSKNHSTTGRVKLKTMYYYDGDNEVKREHFDSKNSLRSIQVCHYNDENQLTKKEYMDGAKKIFQHNIYHYKNGKQVKVEIFKGDKLDKSFENEYLPNGNIKEVIYKDENSNINMIQKNIYDKNGNLVEYRVFKLSKKLTKN